jgi:ABC-2 type transport system permease protein
MTHSFRLRLLTATRYALFEQVRNRLALGLLIAFVPIWYAAIGAMMGDVPVAFQFQPTQTMLQVDGHDLGLLTAGLSALSLIVGFMFFIAARKNTEFDHRLVLSGYPQPLLILGKLTGLVLVTALVSLYASLVLFAFWRPEGWLLVWLGFWCAALIYGAFGLLLGVLVHSELAGFFLIIMVSMLDTFFQNPVDNPIANQPFLRFLPSYAPTQVYVAGGFTNLVPGRSVLLALAWFGGFALLGLAIFWWKTRARQVQTAPLASHPPGEGSLAGGQLDAERVATE